MEENDLNSTSRVPKKDTPFRLKDIALVEKKRRQHSNVLTKRYSEGPLSILDRAVHEKLKVKVWIRSSYYMRAICTGFVVAFDKHFNLAMEDIDESYINPIAMRRMNKNNKKMNKRNNSNNKIGKENAMHLPYDKDVREVHNNNNNNNHNNNNNNYNNNYNNNNNNNNNNNISDLINKDNNNSNTNTSNSKNATHDNKEKDNNNNTTHNTLYLDRYVPKLLVRGDNVVMVAIPP